jgi:RimJ/RimL family protein N-acetyltransferase
VPARPVTQRDLDDIVELVAASRALAAPTAFPGVGDVASVFADQASRDAARCWRQADGSLVAYVVAEEAFGNVLFDVAMHARDSLAETVVDSGLGLLRAAGCDSADTPLESDDLWRTTLLGAMGFIDTGDDVVHLLNDHPRSHVVPSPASRQIGSNAADVDEYVAAHRAAFGTTYLTRARRETWADDPGYDPDLDLGMRVDGELVAFAVSYLRGIDGEIGTVGVVPAHRGKGFAKQMVALAVSALADRGAESVTMSTASANEPMLAVARAAGFREHRRTRWLRRALTT